MLRLFRWVLLLAGSLFVIGLLYKVAFSWGFWAHKEINRQAIVSLPSPLQQFFSANAEYLVDHSIDADQRRFKDTEEQYYHYIDIDRYGEYPFPELPREHAEAVKKFGADSLKKNGLLPWRIAEITGRLEKAMKEGNKRDILFYAADLGHYVADAHVPLHATENYDGQLTEQVGIHSRFESRLPESYGKNYRFTRRQAQYIQNRLAKAFEIVLKSYTLVDSVLTADRNTTASLGEKRAYKVVVRKNGKTEYRYSDAYYKEFNSRLNGLVERRMNDAILALADYWYSAWVDAGKPKLPGSSR
jgi:hypothetical protein